MTLAGGSAGRRTALQLKKMTSTIVNTARAKPIPVTNRYLNSLLSNFRCMNYAPTITNLTTIMTSSDADRMASGIPVT